MFATQDGEVIDVPVKHGEMVKKGQVLARMRNSELEGKLLSANGQAGRHPGPVVRRLEHLDRSRQEARRRRADPLGRRTQQADGRGKEHPRATRSCCTRTSQKPDRHQPDRRPARHLARARHADPPAGATRADPDEGRRTAGRRGSWSCRCPRTGWAIINDARKTTRPETCPSNTSRPPIPASTHQGQGQGRSTAPPKSAARKATPCWCAWQSTRTTSWPSCGPAPR